MNPAENRGQYFRDRERRDRLEQERAKRHDRDGVEGREGERLADLLVPEEQEREVEEEQIEPEADTRQFVQNDGNAGNAAVDDVVRNQKNFEGDGHQNRADRQHDDALDEFRRSEAGMML